MTELIIQSGKHQGRKLTLPVTEVLVGSDDDCQIRVASEDISRRHSALRPSSDGLLVRDLGSRNGTFVNEVDIETETLLQPGDTLRIGPMIFQVPGRSRAKSKTGDDFPEPQGAGGPSANDIVNWLSDNDATEVAAGDETIIFTERSDADTKDVITTVSPEPPETEVALPTAPATNKKFKSIAEEAVDIICRWKKIVDEEED